MARPSLNPFVPPEEGAEPPFEPARAALARIAVLGVNLWVVACLMPALIADRPALGTLSTLVLLPLAIGARLRERPVWAAACLLGLYPAAVLMVVLALDHATAAGAHPPLALALASASLLAYGAVTAQVLARPPERPDVRHRDMTVTAGDPSSVGRRWRRRSILTVATGGALALALVAPFVGGGGPLFRDWGASASAAGALTAAVGGALGALVLAAFVGPGLRRQRPPPPSRQRWRVAMFLLVAASGAAIHTLLIRTAS